jgi:succinoglycan biosynthesis protein ExoA
MHVPEGHRQFWSVQPQQRGGRPFVHATSNVLIDLAALAGVPRPLFDDAYGLSGGGDLVLFSRLFDLGIPMAWSERALAFEEVPVERASRAWLDRRRHRVGNHMVMDEELRQGRLRPALKTAALVARLPIYPLLGREPGARWMGWRLEAAKLRGRIAAHAGLRVWEYARDGVGLRRATRSFRVEGVTPNKPPIAPGQVIVGIPTLDEERHIESCIRGLIGVDPWMQSVDVVVADGGSRDGTCAIVRRLAGEFPNLRLRHNPDRVQAAGLNLVAAEADDRRYLVRCDAHATYPPGYVREAVETLAGLGEEVAAVAAVMDAQGSGSFARAAAWVVDTPLGAGGAAHRGGRRSGFVEHGHHAAFRLDWFRRVGGYDSRFRHNEDAELDHRLGRAGGRVWLEARLRLGYRMREGPWALARQYWNYGRGRAKTVLKHRVRPRARQLLPVANLVGLLAGAVGGALEPWLLLPALAYGTVLLGGGVVCAVAMRAPGGLWAAPALAIIHNAWAIGFVARLAAGVTGLAPAERSPAERAASSATVAAPGA